MREVIQDCYVDKFNIVPSQNKIEEILKTIPNNIVLLAEQYGKWDTEVRENIFNYIKK